ncbi:MAG: phospholipase D-like domain-containing protein, partial [Kiritimatiellia bacterium]
AAFSGGSIPVWSGAERYTQSADASADGMRGRILTERAVERSALALLDGAAAGDQVMLAMFYLSSRPIVRGLLRAHARGAEVRVLLDPNKDAFGREKNGVPNRPVGAELHRAGIALRWALTRGEQFHTKLLARLQADGQATVLLGSSNYTRRNLKNYNLETAMEIRGPIEDAFFEDVRAYLQRIWNNEDGGEISGNFAVYDDASRFRTLLYRIQEATGLSTF